MSKETKPFYEFGPFRVDPGRQLLLRGDEPVPLTSKVFETLLVLVRRNGQVVSKDELMKQLWPDTFVEESNLTQHISMLRKALGESPQDHRYIVTLPGRGYSFAGQLKAVPDEKSARAGSTPTWLTALAICLFAGLLVVSYVAWQWVHPAASATPGRIMLAVLPFQNLTGDPEQEYQTDGVTEEMITQLGRLQPERLGVIARTSVMGYKRTNERMDQIGRELGVQYVLEGSVRREGNQMRITAQLIQVKDQSHLWAREYDRSMKDIFALEDDVAGAVTQEIESRFVLEPRTLAGQKHPVTREAYDSYLKGRYSLNRRTAEGFNHAETFFRAAITADPNYALAYTGLAESYLLRAANGSSLQTVSLQARDAANKALTIDPTLAEPHAILGLIAQNHDWNWIGAEREFKLAMALDPNDATPHHWYSGSLVVRGRFEECFREIAIARQLDPLSLIVRTAEGEWYYLARRYDEAIDKLDRTLEIEPNFALAHVDRGLAYEQKGKWREALADLETARRLDDTPHSAAMLGEAYALSGDKSRARQILRELQLRAKREDVSALYPAIIYAGLGEKDAAFSALEGAFKERATYLLALKTAAIYDPLRSDPRYADLLKRLNLPQ